MIVNSSHLSAQRELSASPRKPNVETSSTSVKSRSFDVLCLAAIGTNSQHCISIMQNIYVQCLQKDTTQEVPNKFQPLQPRGWWPGHNSHQLRSSDSFNCFILRRSSCLGNCAFAAAGPRVWGCWVRWVPGTCTTLGVDCRCSHEKGHFWGCLSEWKA